MCGIIGAWLPQSFERPIPPFEAGLSRLVHRGPNDQGLDWFDRAEGKVVLGHTRLSIIDLTARGHQPMRSRDGRYTLVFNGEVYNYKELRQELQTLGHRFDSYSDTEVLLASWINWGHDCLHRLVGMFAFVIYDAVAGKITCVRDAFGIKPFFYCQHMESFLFASEVPALLALLPRRPLLNLRRVYDYLVQGIYDDRADTFFQGVRQLLPGHMLTLDLSTQYVVLISRWWWPSIAERTSLSFSDAADCLRTMFLDNVRLHLRSDVALGVALSGGVDSSAVVCAIRHVEPGMPIRTFSYVARGSDVDEECWADLINKSVGAAPHKVLVTPEELAEDLDDVICAQGEPFGSTSIYAQYRVYKMAREHGVTVMLDGQGADELLAGYQGYRSARMQSLWDRGQVLDLVSLLCGWSQWPGRSVGHGMKMLIGQFLPAQSRAFALKLVGDNPAPAWLNMPMLEGAEPQAQAWDNEIADAEGRRLMAALRQALTGTGLNALLRHGDRNSMRWSVESRLPFLTTDMAEFLLSLPEDYLISSDGETKHVFRIAMRGIVPDTILDRKDKVGFETPEKAWLKHLGDKVLTWLDAAEELPFLNAPACRAEVEARIEGRKNFSWQAWRLVNFCRWAVGQGYV